jgi:acyl-CoA reductase-like NAD-dependent aldehyde dehydrogenase
MKEVDERLVRSIVGRVLLQLENQQPTYPGSLDSTAVFEKVDEAVFATWEAQQIWARSSLAEKGKVIEALRKAMHANAEEFAQMAQRETGMGRVSDKILKHHNAANNTPGLEDLSSHSWSGDHGLVVEEYAPYGVVAAVTPCTHPIPVLLNSIIMIIAPGNGVVFNVHPAAKQVSAHAIGIFSDAIESAGGPKNLVTMVREPTMESAEELFVHPKTPIIAATGGPAMVDLALRSGKKVVAAGPGNPPVLVDPTACLDRAAEHIIAGASFDNNILCIAEKEALVVASVFDRFMEAMARAGAVRLNSDQIKTLSDAVFSRNSGGKLRISRDFIGKDASVLAAAVGLSLSGEVRLLYGETDFDHMFVQEEQMMPFMPVVPVQDVAEGIDLAVKAERGYGHTAMIHSNQLETITEFSRAIDTDIVVVNGPSPAGNGPPMGEGYFSHTISSPTGEGICTPRNFARTRRICTYDSLRFV